MATGTGNRSLSDLEFLFVVGKGGVGKTTVSAALALALVARKKRVLLAMCNATERLSYLLETDPVPDKITTLRPGLDAVNMNPDAALREYGHMVLPIPALYSAVFENRFVGSFLRGIPGLEPWSMLGKAFFHAAEADQENPKRRRYNTVIVDAPATGHALDMLRVPQVLIDVAPPGLLRREAESAITLLRSPDRAGAVIVTLLEDMPVNETIELYGALKELAVPVQALVANCVRPQLFGEPESRLLEVMGKTDMVGAVPSRLRSLLEAGYRRAVRQRVQEDALSKLDETVPLPPLRLPLLSPGPFRLAAIERLAGYLLPSSPTLIGPEPKPTSKDV